MIYVTLLLPSIFALISFLMSLKFGINKMGIVIGIVITMTVFLYVTEKYPIYYAVNTICISFVAAYLIVFMYSKFKQKERNKIKEND